MDALALEYQRDYGSARRQLDLSDFVNDALPGGPLGIFGLGFEKQRREYRAVNATDAQTAANELANGFTPPTSSRLTSVDDAK